MARSDAIQPDLIPDGIVAWNLRAARELRGWTQTEASEHIAKYGIHWSVASLSDAERSWHRDSRHREFTASDLVTFSLAFDLPLPWWFLPPAADEIGDVTIGLVGITHLDRSQILDLIYRVNPSVDERLARLETSPSMTAPERLRMAAHLEQQEHDLQKLLNDVVAAQEFLKAEGRGNSRTNEDDAQELLKVEGRAEYWTDEDDDDG